tara:strand:+ start:49 stop:507 length:459 start_codon:yes stop_codon:yes gene_type:complete
MAQINSYPIEVPTTTDLIPFSDVSEGNTTKSATVQSIANLANAVQLGYTSLVQLLTQTGTNAPVATEVYNNTGETFTWSYVSSGVYRITSTGTPFTVNKTVVFANPGAPGAVGATIQWNLINSSTIELTSLNLNATTNGLITGGSFEIKIYN